MYKVRILIIVALMTVVLQQTVMADATLHLTDGSINGDAATVTVEVTNTEPVAGLQFDIVDDGNFFAVDSVRVIARVGDWKARFHELDDGTMRVLAFVDTDISTTPSLLSAGEGALLAVDFSKSEEVTADSVLLSFSDIVVSDSSGNSMDATGESGTLNVPTGIADAGQQNIPQEFELHQNYPNPFNPKTTISFGIPKTSDAKLAIFNLLGQEVRTILFRGLSPGYHSVEWNGVNDNGYRVESGIYFYQLRAGDFVQTKKMVMLK